jgi:sulfur carrier protein
MNLTQLVLPEGLLFVLLLDFGRTLLYLHIYLFLLKNVNMKVQVNNKETELLSQSSIQQLALSMELPAAGVAIAVNNKMVPRTEWDQFVLKENDQIVIIKAACGG